MNPLTFNFLIAFVVLCVFLMVGGYQYFHIRTYDDFFLKSRKLTRSEYVDSFAASSTSLATALIFFIQFGSVFGLAILLAPITYFLGACLLSLFVPKLSRLGAVSAGSSLFEFLQIQFASRSTAIAISVVSAIGVFSILLIELFVGVKLFGIYGGEEIGGNFTFAILIFISFVVFIYSSLGGFPGVVRTDKLQLILMWIAAILLLLFIISELVDNQTLPLVAFPTPILGDGYFILPYAIAANVIIVNAFLLPTQLRTWQMAAASINNFTMQSGLIRGGALTASLWTIFAIIGFLFANLTGGESDISTILGTLSSASSTYASYVLFPLVFSACIAALVSTTDSAIIPLTQFLTDVRKKGSLKLSHIRITIIILLLISIGLYFIVFIVLDYDFIRLLFTIFGIIISIGPAVIFAVFSPHRAQTLVGRTAAIISVYSGCAANLIISYYAPQYWVPAGAPASFLLASIMIAPVFLIKKSQPNGIQEN